MAPLYMFLTFFNIPLQKISYKAPNNKLSKSQNSQVAKFPVTKFPSYKMPNDYKISNCYKILKLLKIPNYKDPKL